MQKLVFINGAGTQIDLTAGNFGITNWSGLSNTSLNIQTQQVPFEDGGVFLDALMEQREIEVTVAIYDGNDLALRYQKKRELISALNPKLGEGTLIYTNDYLSRQIKAVPQIPLFENKNSNDAGTLKASVAFSCPSPYWEDSEYTVSNVPQGEVLQIENGGDIPIGFEAKVINKINNPIEIENLTTSKSITLGENDTNDIVLLNTELGKKSLIKRGFVFEHIEGNEDFIGFNYSEKEDLFIFTFAHGVYKTTKDFITYEKYNIGVDVELTTIAINETGNNKIFVINTNTENYYVSTDLENWTETAYPTSSVEIKFLTGLNVFYTVSSSGYGTENKLYKSANATSWTQCGNYGFISPNSICSNADGSLIVASSNILTTSYFLTSTDGMESWGAESGSMVLIRSAIFQYNQFWIIYTNGDCAVYDDTATYIKTVNLDDSGINLALSYSDKIIITGVAGHYTSDGEAFDIFSLNYGSIKNMVYSNRRAIVYGVTTDNTVISTQNGYSWYSVYKANIISQKTVVFNQKYKRYIGINSVGYSKIYASNNGKTWFLTYDSYSGYFNYMIYNSKNQKTYILGSNGKIITDGNTLNDWIDLSTGISETLYLGTSANGNTIVAGNSLYLSKNGTTFANVYNGTSRITCIIYCEEKKKYYAINSEYILQSDNAENWDILAENTNGIRKIIYDTSLKVFVCCSISAIYSSTDLLDFTRKRTISGFYDIIYSEYYECVVVLTSTSNSYLLYSHDLETWIDNDERYEYNSVSGLYYDDIKHNIFMLGTDAVVSDCVEENIINTVTGDMGIDIIQNLNDFFITSNDFVYLLFKYRQKYIGV